MPLNFNLIILQLLLLISAIGSGVGLLCLGGFIQLKQEGYDLSNFGWIPISSFSFTIFILNWGVVSLPFLVISEIMPEKVSEVN